MLTTSLSVSAQRLHQTMRLKSLAENFVYQGGDDCIALKANSTNLTARNVTCNGGTGIAIGSLAQYPGVVSVV